MVKLLRRMYPLLTFFLLMLPVAAHADIAVTPERAQISQTGFWWWQNFSHTRATYREDALHCSRLSGFRAEACWSTLARRITLSKKMAASGMVKWPYCGEVQKSMARYWHDLAVVAQHAGRTGRVMTDDVMTQKANVALQVARVSLQHMADTGQCF